ncbi:geranylgeranyl pyrophosphate synthetase [Penicillium cataractarum]|uniref:Geranylgeranyl pyrophosphate synthetase n=1 Tax=Penicillium cataractarum TaxID=2100454 RepID=A0A9W9VJE3_9EURO|nr:geranylgeranyl pyrophosphate synthetase [Penicillium cataractarum]KAJ5381610.1 geranylgeranyl pyrophosphate synthetase [Penicillium cataractarum]
MASHTAIFCREEPAAYEVIGLGKFRGYGHEFEKAYTTCQIKGSTGHFRVISYQLGSLHFLVRHETDGFVGEIPTPEDSLPNVLNSLTISPKTASTGKASPISKLTIQREGQVVLREATLEIKTRSMYKVLDPREVAPQLWISQTPNIVRAYHERGRFSTPEVEDFTSRLRHWEKTHQDDIVLFIALINRIIQVTKNFGGSTTVQYDRVEDTLVIKKTERRKMLPDDLYALWAKKKFPHRRCHRKIQIPLKGVLLTLARGCPGREEDKADRAPTRNQSCHSCGQQQVKVIL